MSALKDLLDDRELFDESGNLQQGVQILDPESGEIVADGSNGASSTEAVLPGDDKGAYRTEIEKKYYSKSENEKDAQEKELRGDYLEFKKILLLRTRGELFEELRKTDRRRIVLLREHLLQLLAYHKQYEYQSIEIITMITRMMLGDFETDLSMDNTIFDPGNIDNSSSSDDDDSSGVAPYNDRLEPHNNCYDN